MKTLKPLIYLFIASLVWTGCSDDDNTPVQINEAEVITDVSLTFTESDGAQHTYTYTDPRFRTGDYQAPVINLGAGKTYAVSLTFYDKSNPDAVEDITEEIIAEKDDHFVEYRFTGVEVDLNRTDEAMTTDSNGIPIGLFTRWITGTPAQGQVQVTLIHQPQSKDTSDPLGNHSGGETDAQVMFPIVIQ